MCPPLCVQIDEGDAAFPHHLQLLRLLHQQGGEAAEGQCCQMIVSSLVLAVLGHSFYTVNRSSKDMDPYVFPRVVWINVVVEVEEEVLGSVN